ncbi:MAG: Pollen allergen Poa pIX/Phl pVI [Bacteroidetes bacterium]|nr:Pollen allergen Poa pIX/Phl pVI [Bacteroidota bacterium]
MTSKKPLSLKKVIKASLLVSLAALLSFNIQPPNFKAEQVTYPRVKAAYTNKWENLKKELAGKKISDSNFELHLRNFKSEKLLEMWARNKGDKQFQLIKTFKVCALSGDLGPKRKEGDGQVPEGFYEVSRFNPMSDYHLGLKINYPNQSDRIKAKGNRPGGDIMIHGNCVTIGCIPIENDPIEELYIACVEAKSNNNPVSIEMYPCRFTDENWKNLIKQSDPENIRFWTTLKAASDAFETTRTMPVIKVNKDGNYDIQK